MKQKDDSSEVVTKTYLKKELNSAFDRFLQSIRREIIFAMETVEEKFDRKLTKHTNLILTTVDPLLKELETRREDREIASGQSARIKVLESS